MNESKPSLLTSSGLDWTGRFRSLVAPLNELPASSIIIDGEVVVSNEKGIVAGRAGRLASCVGGCVVRAPGQGFGKRPVEGRINSTLFFSTCLFFSTWPMPTTCHRCCRKAGNPTSRMHLSGCQRREPRLWRGPKRSPVRSPPQ